MAAESHYYEEEAIAEITCVSMTLCNDMLDCWIVFIIDLRLFRVFNLCGTMDNIIRINQIVHLLTYIY